MQSHVTEHQGSLSIESKFGEGTRVDFKISKSLDIANDFELDLFRFNYDFDVNILVVEDDLYTKGNHRPLKLSSIKLVSVPS